MQKILLHRKLFPAEINILRSKSYSIFKNRNRKIDNELQVAQRFFIMMNNTVLVVSELIISLRLGPLIGNYFVK
jgi:hypothetical protein